jgi:CRISPR-associated protein Cas5d
MKKKMGYGFKVMISGDYACFTRPEFKVERVSYDVPTPGALEGLLKSIYWKPAIRYVIDQIVVFSPIKFVNIRRNEVKDKISQTKIKQQMNGQPEVDPCIYTTESISQRASMVLKDVRYGVSFHFELTGIRCERENKEGNPAAKHQAEIARRLDRGQFFRTPCLGCSEFPASRIERVQAFDLEQIDSSLAGDNDLGFMTYKVAFKDEGRPKKGEWRKDQFSDAAETIYYRPHLIDGVIDVAKYRGEQRC